MLSSCIAAVVIIMNNLPIDDAHGCATAATDVPPPHQAQLCVCNHDGLLVRVNYLDFAQWHKHLGAHCSSRGGVRQSLLSCRSVLTCHDNTQARDREKLYSTVSIVESAFKRWTMLRGNEASRGLPRNAWIRVMTRHPKIQNIPSELLRASSLRSQSAHTSDCDCCTYHHYSSSLSSLLMHHCELRANQSVRQLKRRTSNRLRSSDGPSRYAVAFVRSASSASCSGRSELTRRCSTLRLPQMRCCCCAQR